MSLIYKPLFEVKLLHEYFITDTIGNTPFNIPDPKIRMEFLQKASAAEQESIDRDLYSSLPETGSKENPNNIKLIPSYSGFKVFIQVNKQRLSDGTEVYEPSFSLADQSAFTIQLHYHHNGFIQYTNGRISSPVPTLYFFCTGDIDGNKSFPYLSNPVPSKTSGRPYEQGELASDGTGIEEYFKDINGADAWRSVMGNQFANESDRILLPLRFKYKFSKNDPVTKVEVVLKDNKGNELKKLTLPAAPGSFISLDFSDVASELQEKIPVADQLYSLSVTGDGGYEYYTNIIFSNQLYDQSVWGVVHINVSGVNKEYNLLEDDGFLVARKNSSGIKTDTRVFEIPVKSRLAYWRYKNKHGDKLDLAPDLTGYLFKTNGLLQTKTPRAVTNSYFLLSSDIAVEKKYLPNPIDYASVEDELDRICFYINVPECDLFPIIP